MDDLSFAISLKWQRLVGVNGPYRWGDGKKPQVDPNWSKSNVIYRWVKNSTGETAHIGETERQLTQRINNYISASPSSAAGVTNKKVWGQQEEVSAMGDFLYLEYVDSVPGFNLSIHRERKLAEHLLIGLYRPYLFE